MYRHLSELLVNYNKNLCVVLQTNTGQQILDEFIQRSFHQNIEEPEQYLNQCFDHLFWSDFAEFLDLNVHQLSQTLIALGCVLQNQKTQLMEHLGGMIVLPLGKKCKAWTNSKLDQIYNEMFAKQTHRLRQRSYQDQHDICICFWLALMTTRFKQHKNEIMYAVWHRPEAVLIISLQGADIDVLSDLFCGDLNHERWLSLIQAEWADAYIKENAGLAVFEQSLNHGQLSLNQVIAQFKLSFSMY